MANRSLSARSRGGAFQALAPKPRTASTHLGAQLKQLRLLQGPDCAHEAVGLARRLELRERVRVGGPGYGSAFMVLELKPGALAGCAGVARYAKEFMSP